jgi:hypothetical protein
MDLTWNLVGIWASIISLALTFINTILIQTIRRRIAAKLTLEPLLRRLEQNSAELNQCLGLALFDPSIDRFNEVMAKCGVNVRTARRRLGIRFGWSSPEVRSLLRAIRLYDQHRTRDSAVEVYNRLGAMIQYIENLLEEMRISG